MIARLLAFFFSSETLVKALKWKRGIVAVQVTTAHDLRDMAEAFKQLNDELYEAMNTHHVH